jgi:ADP-heptose:LPS heptosyltransferase
MRKLKNFAQILRINFSTLLMMFCDSIYLLIRQIYECKFEVKFDVVLIIRLDAVGDFVVWQEYARDIRERYLDKHIVLLASDQWVGLAKRLPYWDRVIEVNSGRLTSVLSYRYKIMNEIRRLTPGLVLSPILSRRFQRDDCVVRLIRSPNKIGMRGNDVNMGILGRAISRDFYNTLIENPKDINSQVEAGAGFSNSVCQNLLPLRLPSLASAHILPPKITEGESYYVLFPGSSSSMRRWSVESFAKIGNRIKSTFGFNCIICGGPMEDQIGKELESLILHYSRNLVGKTTLVELAEIISGAKLVITNETSAVHVAGALDIPTVCVIGGGHYGHFLPYPEADRLSSIYLVNVDMPCFGCNWNCKFELARMAPTPCIERVSVEMVWTAVESALKTRPWSEEF